MKYSELLKEIENYNAKKGFWRRWFGDSPYIKALLKFLYYAKTMHINKNTLPDLDIKFSEFEQFATTSYSLKSLPKHMKKTTLSGCLLFKWNWIDISDVRVKPLIVNSHLTPVIIPTITPAPFLDIPRLDLSTYRSPIADILSRDISFLFPQQVTPAANLSLPNPINLESFYTSAVWSTVSTGTFFSQWRRVFPESNARFFVNADGLVHDDFSSPAPSPGRSLSELNPAPPFSPTNMTIFQFYPPRLSGNQALPVPAIRGTGCAPAA
jgi:hypothetical protein